jgi:cob(I)alamin adenosyltransferase
MGHRLSKIYTRTGDDGTTGLGDGSRTHKDSLRVEAFGAVDELNSVIGQLATHTLPEQMRREITNIQHDLFDIGAELCIPGHSIINDNQVEHLENYLDELNGDLQPLK